MNVKLDDYEVRVLINGLVQQHRSYDAKTNGQIDSLALRLCDIAEAMKPGRKKKIPFEPVETRVIRHRLMEWRNREIQAKRLGAVDALNELLISGKLNDYLADINEQAEEMFSRLVKQLAEKEGLTEALKAENQMLWVQKMNSIRNTAMEVVSNDLIYC